MPKLKEKKIQIISSSNTIKFSNFSDQDGSIIEVTISFQEVKVDPLVFLLTALCWDLEVSAVAAVAAVAPFATSQSQRQQEEPES